MEQVYQKCCTIQILQGQTNLLKLTPSIKNSHSNGKLAITKKCLKNL